MADAPSGDRRGGFGRGRGAGRGGRGGEGRGEGGRGRGPPRPRRGEEKVEWVPTTKLGRLVKAGHIKNMQQVFLHSMPVKEPEIIEALMPGLKDEVMQVSPVQYQTAAGQRTRFRAYVVVGDHNGHIGLGSKVANEVANAIKGAMTSAKLNVQPVRRGFWGNNAGKPHTVPCKVSGKCGSVRIRLIPAPRGTGLVAPPTGRKLLNLAGVEDVYTNAYGQTSTMGNYVKAMCAALWKSYHVLTPNLWAKRTLPAHPHIQHTDFLAKVGKKL